MRNAMESMQLLRILIDQRGKSSYSLALMVFVDDSANVQHFQQRIIETGQEMRT